MSAIAEYANVDPAGNDATIRRRILAYAKSMSSAGCALRDTFIECLGSGTLEELLQVLAERHDAVPGAVEMHAAINCLTSKQRHRLATTCNVTHCSPSYISEILRNLLTVFLRLVQKTSAEDSRATEAFKHWEWCVRKISSLQRDRRRGLDRPSKLELRCLLRYYGGDLFTAGTTYWHECFELVDRNEIWTLLMDLLPSSLDAADPHHPSQVSGLREGEPGICEAAKSFYAACTAWLAGNPDKTLQDFPDTHCTY